MMPSNRVVTMVIMTAMSKFFFMALLGQPYAGDEHVDELDTDERNHNATKAVDPQVATQQRGSSHGAVFHTTQSKRDQGDDDHGVEDHRRQHGGFRRPEVHDVQGVQYRESAGEHGRNDGEILRNVIGDRKGGERAAGHEKLLTDFDDLDQLGGIGVEVHHVAGFLGG